MQSYSPLAVRVTTPQLELRGATDDLLDQLAPVVRAGRADAEPPPYDDPMSLYELDADRRVQAWLRGIWRGRGRVDPGFWRLYLAVVVDEQPIGMQDLVGVQFPVFGAVTTFSWLATDARGRGLGRQMREAALHLAFAGLGAREASSDAFIDNRGSNRISESLGYRRNGTDWATRRGEAALLQRWRITREQWEPTRRRDIELHGVEECRAVLGSTDPDQD